MPMTEAQKAKLKKAQENARKRNLKPRKDGKDSNPLPKNPKNKTRKDSNPLPKNRKHKTRKDQFPLNQ